MGSLNLREASVLAVDENPTSMELLKQIVTGFRIEHFTECSDPDEARKMIAAQPFDLVIIDGEMSDDSGLDLTRFVRSRVDEVNFTVPILIVTGPTAAALVRQARDSGANMVISKPISPAALRSRIDWIARNTRTFVVSETYCGPDRRFRLGAPPNGIDERRAEALALTSEPQREMSQAELDTLFG